MRRIIVLFALLLVTTLSSASFPAVISIAYGQQQPLAVLPKLPTTIQPDGTFQNLDDGFRVKIPSGWAVQDFDNNNPTMMEVESALGTTILATLCNEYLPGLGGTSDCQLTSESREVFVSRLKDLQTRPEVQQLILSQNKTIQLQDLATLHIQRMQGLSTYQDVKMVNGKDIQVNVVVSPTNTTLPPLPNAGSSAIPPAAPQQKQVPAKIVEMTYSDINNNPAKTFMMFVLSLDGNTGYVISSAGHPVATTQTYPPEVQTIFDSFELLGGCCCY